MRYFRDENNNIYAYDESDETQVPYINAAIENGWIEMTQQEVDDFYNPPNNPAIRIAEIKARLTVIDTLSVRPLRAMASGTVMDEDVQYLATLETEAATLRLELSTLESE